MNRDLIRAVKRAYRQSDDLQQQALDCLQKAMAILVECKAKVEKAYHSDLSRKQIEAMLSKKKEEGVTHEQS